jgi:hypothetical protein
MHRFFHAGLQAHTSIRDSLVRAQHTDDLKAIFIALEKIHKDLQHNPQKEELSWYVRHRIKKEKESSIANPEKESSIANPEKEKKTDNDVAVDVNVAGDQEAPSAQASSTTEDDDVDEGNNGAWLF